MPNAELNADLVLEGGGMKGIGLIGAVLRLMRAGYAFPRVGGTSAGSIVAAFLAAGASAQELAAIMGRLDYEQVPDRTPPRIPALSEGISLLRSAGAYEGDYIHGFIEEELATLGVRTFGDLRREPSPRDSPVKPERQYKLVVMATDISNGRLLRLPWDYHSKLGLDPDTQPVADAVRASISIPFYFKPFVVTDRKKNRETTLVDGGVLSNFPIEAFDRTDGESPRWPTFGVKVIPELPASIADLFPGMPPAAFSSLPLLEVLGQVAATAIVGHDQTYAERPCVSRRVIPVDTSAVGIVEFDAPQEKRAELLANGERAAGEFLDGWNWRAYKRDCRRPKPIWRRALNRRVR